MSKNLSQSGKDAVATIVAKDNLVAEGTRSAHCIVSVNS